MKNTCAARRTLLYGELAAALGMARDEVRHDFERRASTLSGA